MASSDEGVAESAGQSVHPGEILRALHQSLIFGSGSRMSRELFRELGSAEGPSAVSALPAFMHTSVALEERRAGVVSTMSRAARLAVEEWAGRATSKSGFRKELGLSFAMVLDDPGRARERALAWCRDVLELRGGGDAQTALAMAQRCGVPEKEALLLTALGHAGDCGAIVDGLSPAVLLLTDLCARNRDELYAPEAVLEYVSDRWTPELGVNVLRRTISDAERSPHTWS